MEDKMNKYRVNLGYAEEVIEENEQWAQYNHHSWPATLTTTDDPWALAFKEISNYLGVEPDDPNIKYHVFGKGGDITAAIHISPDERYPEGYWKFIWIEEV
jgi:hypothetical protein